MKIIRNRFDRFAEWVADRVGKPAAFLLALTAVIIWASLGPFTQFSQTWQLVINTVTTIATFLMVFLLQNTQNRDAEDEKEILEEIRRNQRSLLEIQRRLGERITTIEYYLDKVQVDKPRTRVIPRLSETKKEDKIHGKGYEDHRA